MVQGLMALTPMRRRFRLMFFAGLSVLLIAVPVLPADAGVNTWTTARLYGGTVYGLAASPANPSLVLAGTGAGVFRSTDGGVRWHRSSTGMPHDMIVFTFAFAPSAPDTVFAGTYASGVYRSTDAGRSWVRITSGIDVYYCGHACARHPRVPYSWLFFLLYAKSLRVIEDWFVVIFPKAQYGGAWHHRT